MLYPLSYEGLPLYVRLGYRASVGSSGSGWLPRSRRSVPRAVTRPLAIHSTCGADCTAGGAGHRRRDGVSKGAKVVIVHVGARVASRVGVGAALCRRSCFWFLAKSPVSAEQLQQETLRQVTTLVAGGRPTT